MLLGIDHLVIAVPDPDASIDLLAAELGLTSGASGGYHPGWGTRNRLLWLGDTFIELLAIDDPELASESWLGAPALVQLARGAGLVSWAISTDDLEADAAHLQNAGGTVDEFLDGRRTRTDGRAVRWRLALPPVVSLEHPFLIEHDTTAAEWTRADRSARAVQPGRLVALDLPISRIAGFAAGPDKLIVGGQAVHIGAPGMPAVHVDGAASARSFELLGCRWVAT